MNIHGKVAIIIGGVQGIGRACAEALLSRGAKVCIADIQEDIGLRTLEELSRQYGSDKFLFSRCNISCQDDLKHTFREATEKLGSVSIFCPCAGVVNEAKWELCVDINMVGVIRSTYVAIEAMGKDTGGCGGVVVFLSSTAGLVGSMFQPVYCSTKHAVVAFTRALGQTDVYAKQGIRYNALCPTMTETGILNQFDTEHILCPDVAKSLLDNAKIIQPSSVANAFIKCVEDDSLNGAILRVLQDYPDEYIPDFAENLPSL